jgi:hypothetical protein
MAQSIDASLAGNLPEGSGINRRGRVEVDSRGRNIWRWACDVIESTSVLLKRLENSELQLEPTHRVPIQRGVGTKRPANQRSEDSGPIKLSLERGKTARDEGGGFDPYNSR